MNPGSCTLSPRDDITYVNIFTVFDELDHVKGRTLCEGIKKLRNSTGIERVAKGVQLLLLTIVIASVSELVCETFGSIMRSWGWLTNCNFSPLQQLRSNLSHTPRIHRQQKS